MQSRMHAVTTKLFFFAKFVLLASKCSGSYVECKTCRNSAFTGLLFGKRVESIKIVLRGMSLSIFSNLIVFSCGTFLLGLPKICHTALNYALCCSTATNIHQIGLFLPINDKRRQLGQILFGVTITATTFCFCCC